MNPPLLTRCYLTLRFTEITCCIPWFPSMISFGSTLIWRLTLSRNASYSLYIVRIKKQSRLFHPILSYSIKSFILYRFMFIYHASTNYFTLFIYFSNFRDLEKVLMSNLKQQQKQIQAVTTLPASTSTAIVPYTGGGQTR